MSKIGMAAAFGLMLAAGLAQAQPQPAPSRALKATTTLTCPAGLPVTAPAGWTPVRRGSGGPLDVPVFQAVVTDQGGFMCMYGNQYLMFASPAHGCAPANPSAWQGDLKAVSAITCGTLDFYGGVHPEACQVRCQP
ncbi:hypothetical protein [Phenylobacterium soli]|nr:hypothetical protein [Phenylobacterium soli]